MQQIYPGIYTKAFTLYYGDKVQYYVTETDNKDNLLESNCIMSTMIDLDSTQSRYDLLNDMTVAIQMKDDKTLLEQMNKYTICSEAAESLFKMI
jgi:hypothetical protein